MNNYPDSMTAADHAYLDGAPDCEHEDVCINEYHYNTYQCQFDIVIECKKCGTTFSGQVQED
ncbi:MAG: hypothetical protein CXT67_00250 [Methanobacteriota archaeon]|nr:MAG: hypothetical protein CXT67_00250 [Euryarchaeota archaeon]